MEIKPARILFYESYAFDRVSGELRSLLYFLRHLDRARFTPVIVLPFPVEAMKAEVARGSLVSVISPPSSLLTYGGFLSKIGLRKIHRVLHDLFIYGRVIYRFIRQQDIQVAFCYSLRALLLVGPAARLAGVPILFFVNGRLNNPVLDALAFAIAHRIVFQCRANLKDRYPLLRRIYSRKMAVVESGIDPLVTSQLRVSPPAPVKLGVDRKHVNLIVLGLLNRQKGVHHLLDALARMNTPLDNVRLWVVGDRIDETFEDIGGQLKEQAVKLGIERNVFFTGWRTDALDLLSVMDIVVHPSLSEGMPRAVLEGMSLGKAVIATRVGCCRETIRDGENGLLVNPGDPAELAEGLTLLIEYPRLRSALGKAAVATVETDHDICQRAQQLQRVLWALGSREAARGH